MCKLPPPLILQIEKKDRVWQKKLNNKNSYWSLLFESLIWFLNFFGDNFFSCYPQNAWPAFGKPVIATNYTGNTEFMVTALPPSWHFTLSQGASWVTPTTHNSIACYAGSISCFPDARLKLWEGYPDFIYHTLGFFAKKIACQILWCKLNINLEKKQSIEVYVRKIGFNVQNWLPGGFCFGKLTWLSLTNFTL
jgi:hypothetical protein